MIEYSFLSMSHVPFSWTVSWNLGKAQMVEPQSLRQRKGPGGFGDQQRGHVSVSCGALVTSRLSDENARVAQQGQVPRMEHHSELPGLQTSLGIKNILYNCVTWRPNKQCC